MIKAVIFDFFGVLVTEGFKQFLDNYFSDGKDKRQRAIDLVNQVDLGKISMDEFRTELGQLAGVTPEKVNEELGGNKPNKPLLSIIRRLKINYKISILSNSSMDFPREFLDTEDIELFDDIILSYRYGVVKPDPEIYKIAAARLKVEPEECIFIDDSIGHIQGAESVGMRGIYYKDFAQLEKDLEGLLK
jgi:putative hydrolase of the HAD superfamily